MKRGKQTCSAGSDELRIICKIRKQPPFIEVFVREYGSRARGHSIVGRGKTLLEASEDARKRAAKLSFHKTYTEQAIGLAMSDFVSGQID